MIERLKSAVKASPVGEYLTKAALSAEGLLPSDKYESGSGAAAAKLEWRRKVDVGLSPGAGEETCRRQAKQFGFLGQLPKRAAMWQAVEELLTGPFDATGRLRTEIQTTTDGSVLYLRLHGRRDIHPLIAELPIIALDATLKLDIVKHFLPRIKLALDLEVQAPHERVTRSSACRSARLRCRSASPAGAARKRSGVSPTSGSACSRSCAGSRWGGAAW